jgi:hypothetical protein
LLMLAAGVPMKVVQGVGSRYVHILGTTSL